MRCVRDGQLIAKVCGAKKNRTGPRQNGTWKRKTRIKPDKRSSNSKKKKLVKTKKSEHKNTNVLCANLNARRNRVKYIALDLVANDDDLAISAHSFRVFREIRVSWWASVCGPEQLLLATSSVVVGVWIWVFLTRSARSFFHVFLSFSRWSLLNVSTRVFPSASFGG